MNYGDLFPAQGYSHEAELDIWDPSPNKNDWANQFANIVDGYMECNNFYVIGEYDILLGMPKIHHMGAHHGDGIQERRDDIAGQEETP